MDSPQSAPSSKETGEDPPPAHKIWEKLCLGCRNVSDARFLPDNRVDVTWTQRDPHLQKVRKYQQLFSWSESSEKYVATVPVELGKDVVRRDISPSGAKVLLFRGWEKDGDNGVIEVWGLGGVERAWQVDVEVHGSVYADEWFGGVTWSKNEDRVVYVAERPDRSAQTVMKGKKKWHEKGKNSFAEKAKGLFGETYGKKSSPALFVADLNLQVVKEIFESRSDLFGEPRWSFNGDIIAATMRPPADFDPSRDDADNVKTKACELGIRYCYNRYSEIVVFAFNEESFTVNENGSILLSEPRISIVSDNQADTCDFCCSSPRWHSSSDLLVYLSAPRTTNSRTKGYALPHNTTKILRAVNIGLSTSGLWCRTEDPETLVDAVQSAEPNEFPGLYVHSLPDRPWATADTLVLGSIWGNETRPIEVEFENLGTAQENEATIAIKCKTRNSTGEDSQVLDCLDGKVLLFSSTFDVPGRLIIEDVEEEEFEDIGVVQPLVEELQNLIGSRKDVNLILNEDSQDGSVSALAAKEYVPSSDDLTKRFQATLLVPSGRKEKGTCPLILYPHGGPHSAALSGFSLGTAAFLIQKQAVLFVNYRGSLGQGQYALESLLGRAGTQDISECLQAMIWALDNEPVLDASRVLYHGGSHGGFIGAHLTARFPQLFKRAVLRNPVTNLSSFVASTDIPEWCFAESGAQKSNDGGLPLIPDPDQLRVMYDCSPIAQIVKKKANSDTKPTKTLLQVGGSDRRVPSHQSFEWKRALSEKYGTECVTIRFYPDSGHAIDAAPDGDDAWYHTLSFLRDV